MRSITEIVVLLVILAILASLLGLSWLALWIVERGDRWTFK